MQNNIIIPLQKYNFFKMKELVVAFFFLAFLFLWRQKYNSIDKSTCHSKIFLMAKGARLQFKQIYVFVVYTQAAECGQHEANVWVSISSEEDEFPPSTG